MDATANPFTASKADNVHTSKCLLLRDGRGTMTTNITRIYNRQTQLLLHARHHTERKRNNYERPLYYACHSLATAADCWRHRHKCS